MLNSIRHASLSASSQPNQQMMSKIIGTYLSFFLNELQSSRHNSFSSFRLKTLFFFYSQKIGASFTLGIQSISNLKKKNTKGSTLDLSRHFLKSIIFSPLANSLKKIKDICNVHVTEIFNSVQY